MEGERSKWRSSEGVRSTQVVRVRMGGGGSEVDSLERGGVELELWEGLKL